MAVDRELEDWLLETGEEVARRSIARGAGSLSPAERFLHEIWLLDMQVQNGGVSQYFCNCGLAQWLALRAAWPARDVPSLGPIITEIERVITDASDPYLATLDASPGIDDAYEAHQAQVKAELKRLMSSIA